MNFQRGSFCLKAIAVTLMSCFLRLDHVAAQQQKIDLINVQRVQEMLRVGYDDVHKNYYDTAFHGLDWDSQYHQFDEKTKQISTLSQGLTLVAGMMLMLNDSHTFFIPPSRPVRVEYGFHIQMIGDHAFITLVRPGTDAESKLHPGDEVIAYNRYTVTRDSLWKMNYYFNRLSPLPGSELVLKDPSGKQREVKVDAKVQQLKRVLDLTQGSDIWQLIRESENADHQVRQRYVEMGDVMFWKMPEFDLQKPAKNAKRKSQSKKLRNQHSVSAPPSLRYGKLETAFPSWKQVPRERRSPGRLRRIPIQTKLMPPPPQQKQGPMYR